ncbi:hypothetical protein PTSG_01414 [Salpingoeca rosetta]|uniref:chitin synthase n=1 Tax=Salpingoeca rosetta (strain ATCC 50818 / BSB-021) TaxID=946362 RepID=F2U0A0_SALR5|nr:uncharacterized protein PTSG_01414 [Salpingoeca rosetta]EGD80828.1 hypothetical protein PTSG_01414 [Salpingoeca rosetta]|eukprot:XP_004997389.1 hypothetical protein PTSG_01414 [Salpingoeca rosetta]
MSNPGGRGRKSSSADSRATSMDKQSSLHSITSAQLDTALFGQEDARSSASHQHQHQQHQPQRAGRPMSFASQPQQPLRHRDSAASSSAYQQRRTSLDWTRLNAEAAHAPRSMPPTDVPEPPENPDVFSQRTNYVTEEDFLRQREQDRAVASSGKKNPADTGYISSLVTGVRVDNIKTSLIRKSQRDKPKKDGAIQEEDEDEDEYDDDGEDDYVDGHTNPRASRLHSHATAASASAAAGRRHTAASHSADHASVRSGGHKSSSSSQASSYAILSERGDDSHAQGYASVATGDHALDTSGSNNAAVLTLDHQQHTGGDSDVDAARFDGNGAAHSALEMAMQDVSAQLLDSQQQDQHQHQQQQPQAAVFYDNVTQSALERSGASAGDDGANDNNSRRAINQTYASTSPANSSATPGSRAAGKRHPMLINAAVNNTNRRPFANNNNNTSAIMAAEDDNNTLQGGFSRNNSYQRASYRPPSSQPSYRGPGEMTLKRRHFGGKDRGFVTKVHKAVTDGQVVIPDPHTLRSPVTTVYARHEDFYADGNKSYYVPDSRKKRRMCCVVPCYNEPSDALRRTLTSLHGQLDNLRKLDFDFHVVVIMDGWQLTSESMRTYLQTIFDMPENVENEGPTWWDDLNTLEGNPSVETFIIQNVNIETWTVEPVFIEPEELPGARMHITLIVKRDNRRKHNTLEWFFRSFAVEYGAEYSFTTDCGTLFQNDTIYHLARHLDLFPRCGGVTGRQRVMSAKQQGVDHESWYSAWMRSVQGFEYEATYASYVGAFSMAGMLPVIPGPCGLFNMKHLNGQGVEFFFDKVKQDPDTAGLLLGNGLLAEDRFLSYAAVVSTGKPTITEFVPESVFFFEAETELRTFVFQRRRWNNGTFACFVWLMLNLDIIRKSPHGIVFKLLMQFLIVWQVIWLGVSLIAPALFLVLLRLGVRHTFPANEEGGSSFWADMICLVYMVLYVTFISQHVRSKFEAWLFHVFTLIHGIAVLFIISTFIHAAATRRDHVVDLTLYLFAVYQGAPILLSLIVSPRSCGFLVKYFVPYMIFLPTHTMTFWTYALTRTFDLTWGNRPTTHKVPKNERNLIVEKLKSSAVSLIGFVACINLLIAVVLLQIAVSGRTLWIIWTLVSLMIFSGVQMALSFCFALEYHLIRRVRRWIRIGRLNLARHRRKNKRKLPDSGQSQAQLLEWDNTGVPK